MERIGVLDMDDFYPAGERSKLAMALNNLLASPSFAPWLTGDPIDVKRLLWTEAGSYDVVEKKVNPRKSDTEISGVALLWVPDL